MDGSARRPETLLLRADHDAAARARRMVADMLSTGDLGGLLDDAQLVATELVTNALLHGAPPVRLALQPGAGSLRIEVFDASPVAPMRGRGGENAMTGRGMLLVQALAATWGVERTDDGKVVWAELTPGTTGPELTGDELLDLWSLDDDDDLDVGRQRHQVDIPEIPTELLLAAKTHVDNVIREFTLAAGGARTGSTAQIPPHLAELVAAVVTRFAEPRQEIKRQAIAAAERGDERVALHLRLPEESADAGEAYLTALDELDAYCRAARLLTLESSPQHRLFRRWYVEELSRQLRAAAAGAPPSPPVTFEARLLAELDAVTTAQRSTERSARLYRVTAALAGAQDAEGIAEVVLGEAVEALGASAGGLIVPVDGHLAVSGAVGYDPELVHRIESESLQTPLPAAHALLTGDAIWLESWEDRDARFPGLSGLEPSTVSMCVVPLEVSGRRLGALRFSFTEPRLFDSQERAFVLALAAQAAQALDRARSLQAERDALERARVVNDRLSFLAGVSQTLAATALDFRATLAATPQLFVPRLADWCAVHLRAGDGIEAVSVWHADPAQIAVAQELQRRYPLDIGAAGGVPAVLRTGESVLVPEVSDELLVRTARDAEHLATLRRLGFRSGIVVPLVARGEVFGTVSLVRAASGRPYEPADLALAEDVANRAALAADNARSFAATRETARALQRALLPPALPRIPGLGVAAAYHSAGGGAEVGGDFYDIWPVEPGLWAFAIGDVSGSGPPAATHTGIVRHTLRALTVVERDPADILRRLNDALLRDMPARDGMDRLCTAALGFVRPGGPGAGHRVRLANVGHPPPLLRDGAAVHRFSTGGGVLGLLPTVEPVVDEAVLRPGTALLLYTYGVIERRRAAVDRDAELAAAVAGAAADAASVCRAAERVVLGGSEQPVDDVAILVLGGELSAG